DLPEATLSSNHDWPNEAARPRPHAPFGRALFILACRVGRPHMETCERLATRMPGASRFVSHRRDAVRAAPLVLESRRPEKKYRRFTGTNATGITLQVLATAREKPPAQE